MKVAVCVKRVPDTAEADLKVDDSGKDIVKDRLAFVMNEADSYALEEALLLKERSGAEVTLVSVGPKEDEEVLRMGLAKGAVEAVRIDDAEVKGSDGIALARVLAAFLKDKGFDLVLTGCIAADTENSQVGPALAQFLGWPHASYVIRLELKDDQMLVRRELEGGFLEKKELNRPCVASIQTGGNTPRYASILGIKRAKSKPLSELSLAGIGLGPDQTGEKGSQTDLVRLFVPEVASAAEMIEGDTVEKAERVAKIMKDRGLV